MATPDRPLSYRAWLTPRGAGVRSNDHISHGLGDPGVPPRLSPPRSSDWGGCYRRYGRASRGLPGYLGASRPDFGTGGPRPYTQFYFSARVPFRQEPSNRVPPSATTRVAVAEASTATNGCPPLWSLCCGRSGGAPAVLHYWCIRRSGLRVWPATADWIFLSYLLSCRFLTRGGVRG